MKKMRTAKLSRCRLLVVLLAGFAAFWAGDGRAADLPRPIRPVPAARIDAAEAVKLRQRGLMEALLSGDVSRILGFYSDAYRHRDGTTRRDLRSTLERYFRDYRLLRIKPVQERYTVSVPGSRVTQRIRLRMAQQDRETGQQETLVTVAQVEWSRQSGAWLITREQDGEVVGAPRSPPRDNQKGAQ